MSSATLTHYSFRQLVQMYEHAKSEKHKAQIEHALWETGLNRENHGKRRKFLRKFLGVSERQSGARHYLLFALEADLLWAYIEKTGMSLQAAIRLHRAAREDAPSKDQLGETLLKKLAEYETWPIRMVKGKPVRARPPSMKTGTRRKKNAVVKVSYDKKESRKFWNRLREQIADFMKTELPDPDAVEDQLWTQFETDIKTAMADFKRRVDTAAKRRRTNSEVTSYSRRQIRNAFETLCLDVPRKNQPIDLKAVARNKRKLARLYHPDANAGDESMRDTYQAVLDAAALIEDLAAQRETE